MKNKYDYVKVVQGDYGYGWEDVTQDLSWKVALSLKRDYQQNEPGVPFKIIERRELREEEAA